MGWFKMENKLIDWISLVRPIPWLVFAVLTRHADSDGVAWPSEVAIARCIGCSERTVRRALVSLHNRAWITITYKGHGGSNSYKLHPPDEPDTGVWVPDPDPDTGVQTTGHGCPPDPDTGVHRRRLKKKTKKKTQGVIAYPIHLDFPEVREAVHEWLHHHKVIGKPYKRPAQQMAKLLKQFTTPAEFVAAVDHSIANNYQGLFAPGGKHGGSKSSDRSTKF